MSDMALFARYGAIPEPQEFHDDTVVTPKMAAASAAYAEARHARTLSWAERGLAALRANSGTDLWQPYIVDATRPGGTPNVQIAFRCTIGVSDRAAGCTQCASEPNNPGGLLSADTRRLYRADAEAKAHAVLAPLEQGRPIFLPRAGLNAQGEFSLDVLDPENRPYRDRR
jgi:hypothetical protein